MGELVEFEANSRTHSEKQIQKVVDSINEFGFTNPLLVDENNIIIAGHCRLEAVKRLKFDEVPCIVLDGLSDEQRSACVIADNRLALDAGWDYDILRDQLEFLKDSDYGLHNTGFDEDEIIEIFGDDVSSDDVFGTPKDEAYKSVLELVIECTTELEQEKLYKEFTDKGYKCRILSM